MLKRKNVVKGLAGVMVAGCTLMFSHIDAEAAIRPTNIRWGAGETEATAPRAQVSVKQEYARKEDASKGNGNGIMLLSTKSLANKPTVVEKKMAEENKTEEVSEVKDGSKTEEIKTVEKKSDATQSVLNQTKIETACIVSLDKDDEDDEDDEVKVIDISGKTDIVDFFKKTAEHKKKYAIICRADKEDNFKLYKVILEKLEIKTEDIQKPGVIPKDLEKFVCQCMGTDDILAMRFKYIDPEKARIAKEKKQKMWDGVKGMIPFGLGNLF